MMMQYVVEVEVEATPSVRTLYGPFQSSTLANIFAEKFGGAEVLRRMVRELYVPMVSEQPVVHPNQTTIEDHIADIHDAVL